MSYVWKMRRLSTGARPWIVALTNFSLIHWSFHLIEWNSKLLIIPSHRRAGVEGGCSFLSGIEDLRLLGEFCVHLAYGWLMWPRLWNSIKLQQQLTSSEHWICSKYWSQYCLLKSSEQFWNTWYHNPNFPDEETGITKLSDKGHTKSKWQNLNSDPVSVAFNHCTILLQGTSVCCRIYCSKAPRFPSQKMGFSNWCFVVPVWDTEEMSNVHVFAWSYSRGLEI